MEPFGISITDAGIVGGVFIVGGIVGSMVIPAPLSILSAKYASESDCVS